MREGDNVLGDGSERGKTTEEKKNLHGQTGAGLSHAVGPEEGGLTQHTAAHCGWRQ